MLENFEKVSYGSVQEYIMSKIKDHGALIVVGTMEKHNCMTIGWGTSGVMWSRDVYVAFVKPTRYTYKFVNENDCFSICFLDSEKVLNYCGVKSGRDVNKDNDCELTPFVIDQTIAYQEASLIITLKKIYQADFKKDNFFDHTIVEKRYVDNLFHRYYVGEVVGVYQKINGIKINNTSI